MKNFILSLFLVFFICSEMKAQEQTDTVDMFSFDVNMDIYSRYIWRGLELGDNGPVLQPMMNFNAGNVTLGVFASAITYSQVKIQEIDISLSYVLADIIQFGVTDYWVGTESMIDPATGLETLKGEMNYFEYRKDMTPHIIEGSVKYLGSDNSPVQFLAAVNFYGADPKKADGTPQYSTYLELTYMGQLGSQDFDFFIGGTINNPNYEKGDDYGYYGKNMGICNLGLKVYRDIKITNDFILPVNGQIIINPMKENVNLIIGISL